MTRGEDVREELAQLDEIAALEEITEGGLPSHVNARVVPDIVLEAPTAPVYCGSRYARDGREYPETCQRPPEHPPATHTNNHWHANIGWWQ